MSKTLLTHTFNFVPGLSSNSASISRGSSPSFLPSPVILSILSCDGSTEPLLTSSALSDSSLTSSSCNSVGSTSTMCISHLGTLRFNVSDVRTSAINLNIDISSGKLEYSAILVRSLNLLPAGASSYSFFCTPNVDTQLSKFCILLWLARKS